MTDRPPLSSGEKTAFITAAVITVIVFTIGYSATDGSGIAIIVSLVFAIFAGLMSLGFSNVIGKQQQANETIIKSGSAPSIQCGQCNHVNGPGARFCESCGNPIEAPEAVD